MSIRKLNLEVELQRLARGKRSTMKVQDVAEWALEFVKAAKHNDEVEWLERLYCLQSGNTK